MKKLVLLGAVCGLFAGEPGIRPLIVPQRGEHQLAKEQHAGMTLDRAHELAEAHLHG